MSTKMSLKDNEAIQEARRDQRWNRVFTPHKNRVLVRASYDTKLFHSKGNDFYENENKSSNIIVI